MSGPFLLREYELAVQEESVYGTSPGALAGTDMFKHTSALGMKRVNARYDRDRDRDNAQASVLSTQQGRKKSQFSIEADLIPSGNAATPTEPDVDVLVKAALGTKHKATAHTTTRTGTVGTAMKLVAGGGPASGIQANDLIACDVSTAVGIEVRQVVSLGAAVSATAAIGSGGNGTVTTTVDTAGSAGNVYTIEVVAGVGVNVPLSAAIVGTDITVTLGTDGAGALDPAKNTATLVAAAVHALAGVSAAASGTGADPLTGAEGPTTFTGGLDAGDNLVIDRAFTADPATGRAVYVGTTYKLLNTAAISCHLWRFNGDDLRYIIPGAIVQEMGIDLNYAEDAPVGKIRFSGEGQPKEAQATTARPTPTTAGVPLVPSVGKVWVGATRYNIINGSLVVKNGYELRNRESDALEPNGVKRTGNGSRYQVESTLDVYATTATKTLYDNADTLTAMDTLVQLGSVAGKIVAWRLPSWKPDAEESEQEGEIGYRFTGRAYGTSGDDEVFLAFI